MVSCGNGSIRVAIVGFALGLAGCRSEPPAPAPRPSSSTAPAQAPAGPSATIPAAASVASVAVPVATTSASSVPVTAVRCKARGTPGLITLGTLKDEEAELQARDGAVFVLSFHSALARARVTRFSRDGARPVLVGEHVGLGKPTNLAVTATAAYFSRKGSILRLGFDGGAPVEIAKGWSRAFALHDEVLYGVRRGAAGQPDRLVRVARQGGSPEVLVDFESLPFSTASDYQCLVADGNDVFISDWNGRRVIAISLRERSTRILAKGSAFPLCSVLEAESLVCQTTFGLLRVPRDGGEVKILSDLRASPHDMELATDSRDFWLYQEVRYTDVAGVYRVPGAGGETTRFEAFAPHYPGDPLHVDGFLDLAVDDECVYYASVPQLNGPISILARHKP